MDKNVADGGLVLLCVVGWAAIWSLLELSIPGNGVLSSALVGGLGGPGFGLVAVYGRRAA